MSDFTGEPEGGGDNLPFVALAEKIMKFIFTHYIDLWR